MDRGPLPFETLAEAIQAAFPRLSPKQQRVARFLAANEAVAAFTSATELASRLEVDPATVVRLSKALGFRGYPDLQKRLRARFPHHYPSLIQKTDGAGQGASILQRAFAQDHENLSLGLEMVDEAALEQTVELIGRARRTLVFGGGVAAGVVVFLASSLKTMGFPVDQVAGGGLPLMQDLVLLGPDDLAIGVGFYRYVGQTATFLERARELGVPRVVLTDSPLSPLVPLADHALCAPVESISHRVSLVAPLAVANALVAACASRYSERVDASLRRLDEQYRAARLLMYE